MSPMRILLSENTSSIGRPEISLTEKSEPDIESVTANNSPSEPCTLNIGADEPEPISVSWLFVELEIMAEPVIVWTPDTE